MVGTMRSTAGLNGIWRVRASHLQNALKGLRRATWVLSASGLPFALRRRWRYPWYSSSPSNVMSSSLVIERDSHQRIK